MTITLGAIVQAMPVLNKLAAQELPVRESYRLAKLIRKASVEVEIYERERLKLCDKYGTKIEAENRYELNDVDGFNCAYSELIAQETDLDAEPVKLSDNIKLSAAEIISAEDFIKIEED